MIFKWYVILYFSLILIEKEFLFIKNVEWIIKYLCGVKVKEKAMNFF